MLQSPIDKCSVNTDSPNKQIAALPFRVRGARIELLLITSRETKRWVIPKGWPMLGLKDLTSAKREAFEEAGIKGQMSRIPIGSFAYGKRLSNGELRTCCVMVYPLLVKNLKRQWPEKSERKRKWFSQKVAATLLQEPELQVLVRTFVPPEN